MLRTGHEHLDRLKDGRAVFIGSERVDDVTTHPAFRNAARTVAAIYDMKADPANREAMSFADGDDRCSMYSCKPGAQRICAAACVPIA
jgi:4-hydroxyphenylacetate 3-monooxygenase